MDSYAICTTPRTGSTFLCSLLRDAGHGNPDEWLHAGRIRTWKSLPQLRAWRKRNGVFAIKLFWIHREDRAIVDFDDVLPAGGKWIHLRRIDTLSQSRSYLTALERNEWQDVLVPYGEHDPALIARTEAWLRRHDDDWNRWFRWKQIRPLRLTFEGLIADPEETVATVEEFLGRRGRAVRRGPAKPHTGVRFPSSP